MVKYSTGLIPLVSGVPSRSLTKVRGISARLRFAAISSPVHHNFSVYYAEWEATCSSSLGSWGRARILGKKQGISTKTSSPLYSSSPSGIERFRRGFPNGVASQPSCLLDTPLMNLSSPLLGLFHTFWPLQHPVAVSHNLITPCANRFNAALEPAISTCSGDAKRHFLCEMYFSSALPHEGSCLLKLAGDNGFEGGKGPVPAITPPTSKRR